MPALEFDFSVSEVFQQTRGTPHSRLAARYQHSRSSAAQVFYKKIPDLSSSSTWYVDFVSLTHPPYFGSSQLTDLPDFIESFL
jgi:hypothetical protein